MRNGIGYKNYLGSSDYEANVVFHCYDCECSIFEGDDYYEIEGKHYCEDCLNDNFKKYAEKQDFWEE